MRKKITEHKSSKSHDEAAKLLTQQKSEMLLGSMQKQHQQHHASTKVVFNTAYYTAKNNKPYTDHPSLLDLQKINGVSVGNVLHSNVTCAAICDFIAEEMRSRLVAEMIGQRGPICILIDEGTTVSKKSAIVVYIRTMMGDDEPPTTFFFDLVELDGCDAASITSSLLQCLHKHGLNDDFLAECFTSFCSDGASVMLGKKGGVFAKLKETYPRLVGWHCLNHRLELAVSDAVKCCSPINHFQSFMDKLYALYSQSAKNNRELQEASTELHSCLKKIGRIFGVRWVASSFRAVQAVWVSYAALHVHFVTASMDQSREAKERAMFAGLARKLSSQVFVKNLALMLDALEELKDLSEALQARSITVIKGVRHIRRAIDIFKYRKDHQGGFSVEAEAAILDNRFRGVVLHDEARSQPEIDYRQFYQSLIDSMNAGMVSEDEEAFFTRICALEPSCWPKDMNPCFGEADVNWLCDFFRVEFGPVKIQYREYKGEGTLTTQSKIKYLKHATEVVGVSSAECERGFSEMNDVCTASRSRLKMEHISNLMLIALVGAPVTLWNCDPYVKKWLQTRRSADHLACMKRSAGAPVNDSYSKSIWKLV